MATDPPAGLQIHQHLEFQRRFRVFRRCGMAALVAVLLAALAGLLGSGPLASTRVAAGTIRVDHPRFLHHGHPAWFEVRLDGREGPVDLVLDGALVGHFDLDHLAPAPEQAVLGEGRLRLRFASGTTMVRLELTPTRIGPAHGQVHSDGERVQLRTFVYP